MNKKLLVKVTIAGIVTGTACYISYRIGSKRSYDKCMEACETVLRGCKEAYGYRPIEAIKNAYPDIAEKIQYMVYFQHVFPTESSFSLDNGGIFKWTTDGIEYAEF